MKAKIFISSAVFSFLAAAVMLFPPELNAAHSITRCTNSCVITYDPVAGTMEIKDCCGGQVMTEWPVHKDKAEPNA